MYQGTSIFGGAVQAADAGVRSVSIMPRMFSPNRSRPILPAPRSGMSGHMHHGAIPYAPGAVVGVHGFGDAAQEATLAQTPSIDLVLKKGFHPRVHSQRIWILVPPPGVAICSTGAPSSVHGFGADIGGTTWCWHAGEAGVVGPNTWMLAQALVAARGMARVTSDRAGAPVRVITEAGQVLFSYASPYASGPQGAQFHGFGDAPMHHGARPFHPGHTLPIGGEAGLNLAVIHHQLPVAAGMDIFGAPVVPEDPTRGAPARRAPPHYQNRAPELVYDYGGGVFPIQRRAGVFGAVDHHGMGPVIRHGGVTFAPGATIVAQDEHGYVVRGNVQRRGGVGAAEGLGRAKATPSCYYCPYNGSCVETWHPGCY